MFRLRFQTALLAAASCCFAVAAVTGQSPQQGKTAEAPVELTGKQMYQSYCAACHGADAKGRGPAAAALNVPPPDLTTLSKRNNGTFPTDRVAAVLKNGVNVPAHGSAEMPMWGSAFADIKTHRIVTVRITDLTRYLESLQTK